MQGHPALHQKTYVSKGTHQTKQSIARCFSLYAPQEELLTAALSTTLAGGTPAAQDQVTWYDVATMFEFPAQSASGSPILPERASVRLGCYTDASLQEEGTAKDYSKAQWRKGTEEPAHAASH